MHPVDFAMQLELEGKEFYLKQAQLIEDSHLKAVFEELAADEEKHYQLLKKIKESGSYDYVESTLLDRVPSIFPTIDQGTSAEKYQSYVVIYELAIKFEEQAIDLYEELARQAKSERERETFLMLVREEEAHKTALWRILQFLQRPEEWYPYLT